MPTRIYESMTHQLHVNTLSLCKFHLMYKNVSYCFFLKNKIIGNRQMKFKKNNYRRCHPILKLCRVHIYLICFFVKLMSPLDKNFKACDLVAN